MCGFFLWSKRGDQQPESAVADGDSVRRQLMANEESWQWTVVSWQETAGMEQRAGSIGHRAGGGIRFAGELRRG